MDADGEGDVRNRQARSLTWGGDRCSLETCWAVGNAGPRNSAHEAAPQSGGWGPLGGVRTGVLSVLALVTLAGIAIGVLWSSMTPPEGSAPGSGLAAGISGRESGAGRGGATLGGTISVAPELREHLAAGDTLFIILRKGPGPPFAVKRIQGPQFPMRYQVGSEDVMMAGAPFEGQVTVSARVSKTGGAGPAEQGDLEGEHPGSVAVGALGVDIVISRLR